MLRHLGKKSFIKEKKDDIRVGGKVREHTKKGEIERKKCIKREGVVVGTDDKK